MSIEQSQLVIKLNATIITGPEKFKLHQQVNEHATIYFRKAIEGKASQYRKLVEGETKIEVDAGKTPLFRGIAAKVEVRVDPRGLDYLEVYGISYSGLMDVHVKRRTFQNRDSTLREMIDRILAGYPRASCDMDMYTGKEQLKQFFLQYNETDWTYLKRLASIFGNTMVIADPLADRPALKLGIFAVEERQLDDHCRLNYTIAKTLDDSEASLELDRSRLDQKHDDYDRFYFSFEGTDQNYNLGDRIHFHRKVLYVCRKTAELKGSVLKFGYTAATASGLKYPRLYNEAIVGQAISGKVKEVLNGHIKIDFEIDRGQPFVAKDACLFPYATLYAAGEKSGWYFMPDPGDEVQLHFPSHQEEQAFASYSVRNKQTANTDDPQVKFLRTKDGKEIRLGPKELVITGKDKAVYLQMTDDEGITIHSDTNIMMNAKGNILIGAKENINLSSQTGIDLLVTGGGSVRLFGMTHLRGKYIKKIGPAKPVAALAGVTVPGGIGVPGGVGNTTKVKEVETNSEDLLIQVDVGFVVNADKGGGPLIDKRIKKDFFAALEELEKMGINLVFEDMFRATKKQKHFQRIVRDQDDDGMENHGLYGLVAKISPHEVGAAFDISNIKKGNYTTKTSITIIEVLKKHKFSWQGKNDPCHFTHSLGFPQYRTSAVRDKFQKEWKEKWEPIYGPYSCTKCKNKN